LFENRIKIQEITFRNWDNLLYFFEGNFFFMPMIIGVLVVKRLSVWFGILILLLLILTNKVLIFKLVFDILKWYKKYLYV